MGTPANSINASTTGIMGNTGTAFTATAVTQHDVILGGATSSTLSNVAPSATSGIPLISQGAAADPTFSTAVVAGGGTGATSFNINGPVIANTTTTAAFSSITLNNQKFLVGNTSAAPTSKSLIVVNQVFTSNGTYTPTSGMIYCQVQCLGGGGGGGGADTTGAGQFSLGAGGGAGEYAIGVFSASTIGASQTVTIGAAGTGNSGADGGVGGTTSLGILITAIGGSGGTKFAAGAQGSSTGNLGGTGGTGGDYRTPGSASGAVCWSVSGNNGLPSNGASSQLGAGGTTGVNSDGAAGLGNGSGGGGALNAASQVVARSGGVGTKGIIIITEYILA